MGEKREGLIAGCILSQFRELLCLSRCLYITSTQRQRDPLPFLSLSLFSTRAVVSAVDEKKENIFASICYLVVFVPLSFFFFSCVFFSLFHHEEKNIFSWHNVHSTMDPPLQRMIRDLIVFAFFYILRSSFLLSRIINCVITEKHMLIHRCYSNQQDCNLVVMLPNKKKK